jgi:NAD(P)H dehydrogenase (quinone)
VNDWFATGAHSETMFSITGITGNVGGNVAYHLLAAGRPIRAVVRDGRKSDAWAERGCEVAIADITDAAALASAFKGAEGVFVLVPPNFDPALGFPEAQEIAATLKSALEKARPGRVVYLSTIGAQASERNLLTQHTIIEQTLSELPMPITFLRPAWFMENSSSDVVPARENGVISSFLQPLTSQFQWLPPPTSGVWLRNYSRTRGRAAGSSSWKGHTA